MVSLHSLVSRLAWAWFWMWKLYHMPHFALNTCCPHCWRTFIKERYGYVEGEDEADEQQTVSDTASSAAAAAPQPTQPQVPTAAKSAPPKPFGLPVRARGRSRTPPPRSAARSRAAAEHTVQAAPVAEVPARPRVTSFSPKKRAVKTEPAGDKCPNSWCNRPGGEYTGGHCCKFCAEWFIDKTKLDLLYNASFPVKIVLNDKRRKKLNASDICHCSSCDLRDLSVRRHLRVACACAICFVSELGPDV